MNTLVNQSLKKVIKSAPLVLFGTGAEAVFGILIKFLLIRWVLTTGEFGIYSAAMSCFIIIVTLSTVGLRMGVPRQIAFYRGMGDDSKVRSVAFSGLQIVTISGILFGICLFLTSDNIAELVNEPQISNPLKVFAIAIPLLAMNRILVAIFQGFGIIMPKIYFGNVLRYASYLLLIGIVIIFNLSLLSLIWCFVLSIAVTLVAFIIYTIRRSPLPAVSKDPALPIHKVRKELFLFSLPLLFVVIATELSGRTDTLLIMYYMGKEDVGLYNAAIPLVHILPLPLVAITFLYVPIMSELCGKNRIDEIRQSYSVLTRWIFFAALPLFLVFVFFPEATLNTFCGTGWLDAASSLQILSIGFFINTILGPNGITLTSLGKPKSLMWITISTLIIGICLNIILIPEYGLAGAATATSISLILRNIFISVWLYSIARIHPFSMNLLKPTGLSLILILMVYYLVEYYVASVKIWMLPLFFALFMGTYGVCIVITRSFDKEDIMILLAIERKMGLDLTLIKRILNRFI